MYEEQLHAILFDLLESFHCPIITDDSNRIIFFGHDYADLLDVRVEDVIGQDVRNVIKNTRMHLVLESNEEECGKMFYSVSDLSDSAMKRTPLHMVNRIPIRTGGLPNGKVLGVFASGVLTNFGDIEALQAQISELQKENAMIASHLHSVYKIENSLNNMRGSSAVMEGIRSIIRRVASSTITVTISGATGTGKEVAADAIHYLSPRKDAPFIKVNCAAILDTLIESELFGYEPGAYTGASSKGAIGKFELAHHGTILLDEIGDMPLAAQSKLLRVLQQREVTRIGGHKAIPVDIRVLCSTNRNLRQMVNQGTFREDLYYRINVLEIELPLLRDHREDIPELCDFFIERFNAQRDTYITGVDPSVYDFLSAYSWPGNVRELEHAVETACVLAYEGKLYPQHFDFLAKRAGHQPEPGAATASDFHTSGGSRFNLKETMAEREKSEILAAIENCGGNMSAVARALQMNRTTLYRKLKRYQIPLP